MFYEFYNFLKYISNGQCLADPYWSQTQ